MPDHDNCKLLVRRPTRDPAPRPNEKPGGYERPFGDQPVRVYVPLMLRPWVMDRTHKPLGEKVTLAMLERYFYWVEMASSVKWWIRRCYACQARKKTRGTVRLPLVSLPLPSGPGQMVVFDLLGSLPRTNQGNEHVLLVVDRFSRHAQGYALSADEKTTQGCAAKLVHDCIPRWGSPHTFLSDRGPESVSTVCREIFRVLGAVKRFTSSAHAQTNGVVEKLNHTLRQMLPHLIADNQTNWDELLLHAIAGHNSSVSRGMRSAPNEVHIGRYPRLPMTFLEGRGIRGHQGLRRNQLDFLQFVRERQSRAYELVRKEDFLIKAKHQPANEKLDSNFRQRPNFAAKQWVWVYDDKSTINGRGKHVLKAPADGSSHKSFALVSKLPHCWTGPYKALLVGPGKAPDGDIVGRNLLLLDTSQEDSRRINARVSVHRCKRYYNPHEEERRP